MDNYHVVFREKGWEIKGADILQIFNTKKSAVEYARRIAQNKGRSIIIHSQDGRISSVVTNGRRFAKGRRIKSANVKHRLNGKDVRKSIANVMSERNG